MDAVLFISWTVAVVFFTLLWVHVSAQTQVARTATNSLKIAIRLIAVHYVLQQFILGFPDRHLVIPNPERTPAICDPPARKADTGIAFTALRPMGTIEIAGERFNAASESGTMIMAGAPVRVVGSRGTLYLVAPIAE